MAEKEKEATAEETATYVERFFEGGPDGSNIDWRAEVVHFAAWIIGRTRDSLPEEIEVSPFDIMYGQKSLRGIFKNFDPLLSTLDNAQCMQLRRLLAATFGLGRTAAISPEAMEVWARRYHAKTGKVGAATNQKKAATRDEAVLERAKEMRAANPKLGQDDLATNIIKKWDTINTEEEALSHSYLRKLISEWEGKGLLPKAKPKRKVDISS